MGAKPKGPHVAMSRRREEVCDYCYEERKAVAEAGEGRSAFSWSGYKPPPALSQLRCVCGPEVPCRSVLCTFHKKSLGGNQEPQGTTSEVEKLRRKQSNDAERHKRAG